jgi:mannose-1-phosphate guanylyltransferase
MAGGIGSRFWPLSTTNVPKQFLDILGVGKTLIQLTFERMRKICPVENIYIVTNAHYETIVLEQLPELKAAQVLKEPMRKNTAPCIAYGNAVIKQRNPDANILVTPSDHLILNEVAFTSVINEGLKIVAENDFLLTIGIKPSRPDTGYGYIQLGKQFDEVNKIIVNKVKTFTEKPELEMAKVFLRSGDFFWNAGIFMWSLKSIQAAFARYLPEVSNLFDEELTDVNNMEQLKTVYAKCTSVSIDYGVMEKSDNVYVLQSDFGWSDLGTWGALYENTSKDNAENALIGQDIMMYDSKNCMVSMPAGKIAIIEGLDGYIVVDSSDKLLICRKDEEQRIRQFVNDLKMKKGDAYV